MLLHSTSILTQDPQWSDFLYELLVIADFGFKLSFSRNFHTTHIIEQSRNNWKFNIFVIQITTYFYNIQTWLKFIRVKFWSWCYNYTGQFPGMFEMQKSEYITRYQMCKKGMTRRGVEDEVQNDGVHRQIWFHWFRAEWQGMHLIDNEK